MKLRLADYEVEVHVARLLAAVVLLYLLLSGEIKEYTRFVHPRGSVTNCVTLSIWLTALMLSIRLILSRRGPNGH